MRKALVIFCFMLTTALIAQNSNQVPQNTPGEISDPISNNKTGNTSSIESIDELYAMIDKKQEVVQSLYFIEEESPQTYGDYASGGEIVTRQVKRKIYKAGQVLLEFHKENMSTTKSDEEKLQHLREIIKVNDRLIQLGQIENTKTKEKELKKLKDVETIRTVFFKD